MIVRDSILVALRCPCLHLAVNVDVGGKRFTLGLGWGKESILYAWPNDIPAWHIVRDNPSVIDLGLTKSCPSHAEYTQSMQ